MSYRPPQKRVSAPKKDEFPALPKVEIPKAEIPKTENKLAIETKMKFADLFKRALKKKNKVKKLKWGTVLLTKHGMIDSLTPEERVAEEEVKDQELQDHRLWKFCARLEKQQNVRREFDPHYESPEEFSESESEEEVEEEEEVLTDEYEEDEFEPDI